MTNRHLSKMRDGFKTVPLTGNPKFDKFVNHTDEDYLAWKKKMNELDVWVDDSDDAHGLLVEAKLLADTRPMAGKSGNKPYILVSKVRTTFIDLQHEEWHAHQIHGAIGNGIDIFDIRQVHTEDWLYVKAWMEKGAHEYELRLAEENDFTQEYVEWVAARLKLLWTPEIAAVYQNFPQVRELLDKIPL